MTLLLTLLTLLGHSDFRTREASHAALAKLASRLPGVLWPALTAAGRAEDQETAARCRTLADLAWSKLPGAVKQNEATKLRPLGWRKLPWLELHGAATHDYVALAGQVTQTNSASPRWDNWRVATQLWVQDVASQGWQLKTIQLYLEQLRAAELTYWAERR